jgi:hypothetical protein
MAIDRRKQDSLPVSPAHLCENAKALDGDRRSYSSKTLLAIKLASALNLKNELKNVVLAAFRSFAFLLSQGQKLRFDRLAITSGLPG